MPYCTQNDLETLISVVELAELTNESGIIPNSTIITEIINRVDNEIDSYISVRYKIPFDSTPDIIKKLSIDMTIYYLYTRRSTVPLIRRTNYEDAIRFLQNVAIGKIQIIVKGGVEIKLKSFDMIKVNSSRRVFSRSY
jgi:phage gp36-like protein